MTASFPNEPYQGRPEPSRCVLLVTSVSEASGWLRECLGTLARVEAVPADPEALLAAAQRASVVLVDFRGADHERLMKLCATVRQSLPLPLVALGDAANPADTLSALRASAKEFIDASASALEIRQCVAQLFDRAEERPAGNVAVAVLGARAGLGASTVAVNLAVLLQARSPSRRVLLLDMGLPVADSQTSLGLAEASFTVLDAVRSLDRLDRVMADSAIAREKNGLAVLPLPARFQELRDVPPAALARLIQQLRSLFDAVVVDLGGFTNHDFVAALAGGCATRLVVCDQAMTSIVSTARMLDELRTRGLACELVVTKTLKGLAPAPADISRHLALQLAASLPHDALAHGMALNEGRPLAGSRPGDPYVTELQALAASLAGGAASSPAPRLRERLRSLVATYRA